MPQLHKEPPLRGRLARGEAPSEPAVPYEYRRRSYPWAERTLAAAEAEHGAPSTAHNRPSRAQLQAAGKGRCTYCGRSLAMCVADPCGD